MEESLGASPLGIWVSGRAGHLVELAWMQARDDHGQQLGIVVTTQQIPKYSVLYEIA